MNFSSFVSPFSVTSAINNHHHHQFAPKFGATTDEVNGGEANTDTNSGADDSSFLRVNAESAMMMAVSRYQNSAPRFNQQNLLHKYYRENNGLESIATNCIGSSFTTAAAASTNSSSPSSSSSSSSSSAAAATVTAAAAAAAAAAATSSLSLIPSKFRATDHHSSLSSLAYGNLRNGNPLPHTPVAGGKHSGDHHHHHQHHHHHHHQHDIDTKRSCASINENGGGNLRSHDPLVGNAVVVAETATAAVKIKEEKETTSTNNDSCAGTINVATSMSSMMPLQSQPAPPAATSLSVASWQSIAAVAAAVAGAPSPSVSTTSAVADYLSHLPGSSLPISLQNLFKYSTTAENTKKEPDPMDAVLNNGQVGHVMAHHVVHQNSVGAATVADAAANTTTTTTAAYFNGLQSQAKKRKRKKPAKEKKAKPKPGEIRVTTALDGSALFCCPECHMAYPDKGLLQQHLLGHTIERRFFCDICGAGLKRKDHLTRHKQSHNPDRPHACSVCAKAFKRKEQLALHYVIHSGEKRHVCPECGKGFYRKDHLRKHTRSHIARRVKAELSQYVPTSTSGGSGGNGGNGGCSNGQPYTSTS